MEEIQKNEEQEQQETQEQLDAQKTKVQQKLWKEQFQREINNFYNEKKEEELKLGRKNKSTYIAYNDPEFLFVKEIEKERADRYQAQLVTEYYLQNLTYFDFFSKSAFEIVCRAKAIALSCKHETVSSETLLISFFKGPLAIRSLLQESQITQSVIYGNLKYVLPFDKYKIKFHAFSVLRLLNPFEKKSVKYEIKKLAKEFLVDKKEEIFNTFSSLTFLDVVNFYFDTINNTYEKIDEKLFPLEKEASIRNSIPFDSDTNHIFLKASENALQRFHTPIITTDILLITLLEEPGPSRTLLHFLIPNETEWYLLRYKLIKKLYLQEVTIRTEVSSAYIYFAYLLQTKISDLSLDRIFKRGILLSSVAMFRENFYKKLLKTNIYKFLAEEIYTSIEEQSGSRDYSDFD